jgi:hypothetical protein
VSDRYAIASGETEQGPWALTLDQARITGTSVSDGDEATWWCLDLDGPAVENPETPEAQQANICNLPSDVGTETFGPTAGFPGFPGEETLVYGQVSTEVARLQVKQENGDVGDIPLILPPEETDLQVQYFVAFVPGGQTVELVALDDDGQILGTRGHPA